MSGICVLITLYNDPRVVRTIESLKRQSIKDFRILVADGGSTDGSEKMAEDAGAEVHILPGSVAETRNAAMRFIDNEDIVAFIDSDEVAHVSWLERLVAPIMNDKADITGGPTEPLATPESRIERYINQRDRVFYHTVVPENPYLLPMGNSAWRAKVIKSLGGFDTRFTMGGEDYDLNIRAFLAGYRFMFVKNAYLYHDQSGINDISIFVKKRLRYQVGAALAYRKNTFQPKATFKVSLHPLGILDMLLKPYAYLLARKTWAEWTASSGDVLSDEYPDSEKQ